MTTDRKLLELAAKAVGIKPQWRVPSSLDTKDSPDPIGWNPLLNDGDAFRLAVKLSIDTLNPDGYVKGEKPASVTFPINDDWDGLTEWYAHDDDCAAMRRVIVRAAAKIGRATP
jgi:hypothetical protein